MSMYNHVFHSPHGVVVKALLLATVALPLAGSRISANYVVVVSKATRADSEWHAVVETLVAKYEAASVLEYENSVAECLPKLQEHFPRYVCFVATPSESTRGFVAQVHRVTRRLDDDPFTDCVWGILTGFDADNALAIAKHKEPLVIRRAAAGTEIALEKLQEGRWYCELNQHKMVHKDVSAEPKQEVAPADTTSSLVDSLNEYKPDLFVTSGHATERDWQIGYAYRNGYFRSQAGSLFGVDTKSQRMSIHSPNPKVYLPIGNCLMGHIDGTDAMALAWMNSAGVHQMIGYTVLTWYGYAGWGVLDYFVEQPGRYNFAEAFYANQQALLHRIEKYFPDAVNIELDANGRPAMPVALTDAARSAGLSRQDAMGLLYDRDALAFYGDPAWDARLADGPLAYDQRLAVSGGEYTVTISGNEGERSFEPVNTNGSQRGWRPIVVFLPHRVKDINITDGHDLAPVVTDNFVLIPNPRKYDPLREYRVSFTATRQ